VSPEDETTFKRTVLKNQKIRSFIGNFRFLTNLVWNKFVRFNLLHKSLFPRSMSKGKPENLDRVFSSSYFQI